MNTSNLATEANHPTIKKFLDYISENPNLSKTIENCAEHLAIGPRQLRRICRHHLNASPSQVIRSVMVNHAQQQLSDNAQSIKVIAAELGFSNSSNFSNYFKKAVGQSPRCFRKQNNFS